MASNSSTSSGIGFGGVLFIVFLVLKLCHVITWSWWWVTSPIWIPTGLVLLIMGFCVVMAFATGQVGRRKKR